MSKYIRTKDKILEVVEENERYYKCCYDDGRITLAAKFDNDVNGFSKALNQADTIEELSDRVFAFHKEDNWGIPDMEGYYLDELKEEIIEDGKNSIDDFIFKLAIWTDKGLIYVAKINEEGELELI